MSTMQLSKTTQWVATAAITVVLLVMLYTSNMNAPGFGPGFVSGLLFFALLIFLPWKGGSL